MTLENPGPGLRQEQTCCRVQLVTEIPALFS